MWKFLSIAAFSILLAACVQRPAQPYNATEAAYCDALARQFDRYYVRGEGSSGLGTLDRAIGQDLCQRGEYAQGQERLVRAVTMIGFVPVARP